ncbi:class II aaRS and biotin synthetase [Choiromyces venosus 120613-1]|uniref:Class II aaRS and biotin synthetase n=1 Tax=Choiromyces venosus 120613-1 TaxID=1336337 RepID=A0A3N4JDU4_9PEZI|nr:class II aaRS and biotin synthetase [Choiromyces venosus 120613-1]
MGRMNVLVYSGTGTTVESVRHCLYSLRRLLSPNYAVIPTTADTLLKEPWETSCALLIIPGGADLGYCRVLNGEGNRKIAQFVRKGGAFIGFCAGGYYGCKMVEFEVGNGKMEVVGSRELQFFPGACRGAAFAGFQYASEKGARAPKIKVEKEALGNNELEGFNSYYNGGGLFVDADKYADRGVEVLARFEETEKLSVEGGDAAVVYCKIGNGGAILTGPHPEFAAVNLDKSARDYAYRERIELIEHTDNQREAFLRACLVKLGLNISEEIGAIPSLSLLHLSSTSPADVGLLADRLRDISVTDGDKQKIIGENDTFILERNSAPFSMGSLADALAGEQDSPHKIIDYNKVVKHVQIHDSGLPPTKDTPYFDHAAYFEHLKRYRSRSRSSPENFGSFLLYGEVVTSTNTMLDKNFELLQRLPSGLTAVATLQVAARGRGSNVWVSPMGALVFSTCIRHPRELSVQAPVVFVQYLVALAIVEAIKSYDIGFEDMPVRLKWPNDIYAENPKNEKEFLKIAGILVNSSYANNQFLLVVGCGINTTNNAPTTSLNHILDKLNRTRKSKNLSRLPSFEQERLLAKILVVFEEMYYQFCRSGFAPFEELYYRHWLHSGQIVRLEMEGGRKARIRGITPDYGLLTADELDESDRLTGRSFTLQSDNNSFDFFKGLLRRKT